MARREPVVQEALAESRLARPARPASVTRPTGHRVEPILLLCLRIDAARSGLRDTCCRQAERVDRAGAWPCVTAAFPGGITFVNSAPAAVAGATALGPPCAATAACAFADRLYPPYANARNRRITMPPISAAARATHTPR